MMAAMAVKRRGWNLNSSLGNLGQLGHVGQLAQLGHVGQLAQLASPILELFHIFLNSSYVLKDVSYCSMLFLTYNSFS
jgi:hypothetical protein